MEAALNRYYDHGLPPVKPKKGPPGPKFPKAAATFGAPVVSLGACSHGNGPDCEACANFTCRSRAAPENSADRCFHGNGPDCESCSEPSLGIPGLNPFLFAGQRVIVGVCTAKYGSCRAGEAIEVSL